MEAIPDAPDRLAVEEVLAAPETISAIFGDGAFSSLRPHSSLVNLYRPSCFRAAGTVLAEDLPFRRVLHYLFFASRGGAMRWRIVESLATAPRNMNQLAEDLHVNYKTVQHHVRILEENEVLIASKAGSYGAAYFLTGRMESSLAIFRDIWKGMGGK